MSPGFTATVALVIALAVGVTTALFALIDIAFLHENADGFEALFNGSRTFVGSENSFTSCDQRFGRRLHL